MCSSCVMARSVHAQQIGASSLCKIRELANCMPAFLQGAMCILLSLLFSFCSDP